MVPLNLAEPSLPVSGVPGVKFPSALPLDMMSTVVPTPPVKVRPVVLNVRLVTTQFPTKHGWPPPFCLVWCLCGFDDSNLACCAPLADEAKALDASATSAPEVASVSAPSHMWRNHFPWVTASSAPMLRG